MYQCQRDKCNQKQKHIKGQKQLSKKSTEKSKFSLQKLEITDSDKAKDFKLTRYKFKVLQWPKPQKQEILLRYAPSQTLDQI